MPNRDDGGLWRAPQRRALTAILVVVLIALAVRFFMNRTAVPDPQPAEGSRYDELADRLDPNTADRAALAAIPTLGEKRAAAIVDYRERFAATHSGLRAFGRLEDLMNVPGIGPATLETMRPYLKISSPAAMTRSGS